MHSLAYLSHILLLSVLPAVVTVPADAPPAVWSPGAAFDAARGRLMVVGGYYRGQYHGDTWEWHDDAWTRAAVNGPSPRNAPALAYDAARRQIVLFGGDAGSQGAFGDTWVHDGRQWRRVATSGPSPRSLHTMVYDERRGRIVLFGGLADGRTLGDTWEWDGEHWTLVAREGPPPRSLHGFAYDAARGRAVLFGGQGVLAPDSPSLADVWEWDGARWHRVDDSRAGPRDHVAMDYDPVRRVVVVHTMGRAPSDPAETWTNDGHTWNRVSTTGPRRGGGKLVFDAVNHYMLLYGGGDGAPTNELWSWDGASWTQRSPRPLSTKAAP